MRCNGTSQACKDSPGHSGSLWLYKLFCKTKTTFHTSPETQKDSGFTKADLTSCELTWNKGFFLVLRWFFGQRWGIGQGGLLISCWWPNTFFPFFSFFFLEEHFYFFGILQELTDLFSSFQLSTKGIQETFLAPQIEETELSFHSPDQQEPTESLPSASVSVMTFFWS